jgi:hypothetical protein
MLPFGGREVSLGNSRTGRAPARARYARGGAQRAIELDDGPID